jgi:hypothetical protein
MRETNVAIMRNSRYQQISLLWPMANLQLFSMNGNTIRFDFHLILLSCEILF